MKDQPDRTFQYPDQCTWEEQLRATEQRARVAEARYANLVNRLPAVITMAAVDDQASTLYQSPYMETMLGYTPQEWLDDPNMLEKVLHPDDRAWVMALNRETNASGQPFRAEYRVIARDGRIVWINDEEVQVHDGDGVHWHGIMMDVTERKQTEERMREVQARYRTLVEQLPAVTYIDAWNEDGLTYISPQIESLLGYPAGDWITNPTLWQERIHPEDRARMIQADRDTDATGNNLEAEYRMIAADEGVVWVRDQANLVRASDGTPLYWHGIMMDITRQRNAEGRVLEAQNRFQTLVEQMPAATYLEGIGHQKHMLYVSPQIEKVLGYHTQQWLSIPNFWDTVIHPDDRDWVAAADRTPTRTGRASIMSIGLSQQTGERCGYGTSRYSFAIRRASHCTGRAFLWTSQTVRWRRLR